MEEDYTPRRRDVGTTSTFKSLQKLNFKLTLAEILVVFSSTSYQSAVPVLNDPVSMSLRALMLCELIIREEIYVDADKHVVCRDKHYALDAVHSEVYDKIKASAKPRTVDKWLLLLNGESYSLKKDKYHVKRTRERIGQILIAKKIFCKPKGKKKEIIEFFTRKSHPTTDKLAVKGIRTEISNEISRFLLEDLVYSESDRLRLSSLVCAFMYCNLTEDVFLTLPPSASDAAQKKANEIVQKYKTGVGVSTETTEWSVLCVIREYVKIRGWL